MRSGKAARCTRETDITAEVCLDGGRVEVSTGIGFFDHMLEAFAVHGGFGLILQAKGDLHVDGHHTVEDTGIVLGKAFAEALGGKSGIARFGASMCRWMKRWGLRRWMSAAGRILCIRRRSGRSG